MTIQIEHVTVDRAPNEFWFEVEDGTASVQKFLDINQLEKLSMALDRIIEGQSESEVIEL